MSYDTSQIIQNAKGFKSYSGVTPSKFPQSTQKNLSFYGSRFLRFAMPWA